MSPACVAGSEGGGEEQGKQSTGRGRRRKMREGGVEVSRVNPPPFSLFLLELNSSLLAPHDYSLLIIPRVPEPIILNRIPKYNRWSAYWLFDYIKDRFSKFYNGYQGSII